MKKIIILLTLAISAAGPRVTFAEGSIESDPAYLPIDKVLDLKAIPPQVNVNLPHFLLKDALTGLSSGPSNALAGTGVDLPDLLKDVKLIRVVVIETKTNRVALEKSLKSLRSDLDSKWTSIVSLPEDKVGVYAMGDPSGESVAGVAVLIYDHGEAVIVNIVGHVSIGKLLKVAAQTNKLPKDLLKQLGMATGETIPQPAAKVDTTANTNKPIEAPQPAPKESADK
jgi:hypothetical protein